MGLAQARPNYNIIAKAHETAGKRDICVSDSRRVHCQFAAVFLLLDCVFSFISKSVGIEYGHKVDWLHITS